MTTGPLARWSSLGRSARLRAIGTLVLVCGVLGAGLFYWLETRAARPTIDELMPGYAQARQRQIGIMLGSLGTTLMGALDVLKEARNEAILIAAVSALVALGCFRVARLMDLPDVDPPATRSTDGHGPPA